MQYILALISILMLVDWIIRIRMIKQLLLEESDSDSEDRRDLRDEIIRLRESLNVKTSIIDGLERTVTMMNEKVAAYRPEDSYEVKQLMNDLTAGRALVEVRRIAPEDFFLRSPRG